MDQEGVLGMGLGCWPSHLGLALSIHGFMHGLFVSQEMHELNGLQAPVQFTDNGNTQGRLHDALFQETLPRLNHARKAAARGLNQHLFPLLGVGNYFFIPKGQSSNNSDLQTLTEKQVPYSEVCTPAILAAVAV
ncbi:hypothetical protein P7K49_015405 [Saguinus oedipus]|uniref:Uncharacterized protein n=1 Tax=Saguinus oedipus TaxID=9490 RepID=A0ABQ9V9R2_SAGOE|nr:hypothetical protein P7K49_015405 [Saguinus oedipus]